MNRTIAPEYSQAKNLNIIAPERIEGLNGVEIFLIRDVKDDSVKIDFEWNAGSKYQEKKLVASLTNKLLFSGTKSKTANQIAEEIDFFGGYTSLEVDKDHSALTIYGLNENISKIFDLVQDAFFNVEFPERQLAKEITIAQSKYKVEIEKVSVLCRRTFNVELYGANSPYGQVADVEDFENVKREDLQSFYQEKYLTKPIIFITGNVSDEFIEKVKESCEKYTNESSSLNLENLSQYKGEIRIDKEDAIQSAIRVGRLMFDKNHPDYFALKMNYQKQYFDFR